MYLYTRVGLSIYMLRVQWVWSYSGSGGEVDLVIQFESFKLVRPVWSHAWSKDNTYGPRLVQIDLVIKLIWANLVFALAKPDSQPRVL